MCLAAAGFILCGQSRQWEFFMNLRWLVLLLLVVLLEAAEQTSDRGRPQFAVASVKPSESDGRPEIGKFERKRPRKERDPQDDHGDCVSGAHLSDFRRTGMG
jgi:hypothetical protein